MNNALVVGYYGHHNAGDDAFLAVCAWAARKHFGCDRIDATAQRLPATYGVPVHPLYFAQGLRGSWRWNFARTCVAARRADTVIFGGGSNFHTTGIIEHYRDLLRAARPGHRVAAGVSLGPFLDSGAEAACARILGELDFTGVRDAASLERARRIAPSANVELTFDIAPLMLEIMREQAGLRPPSEARHGLGIALCNLGPSVGAGLEEGRRRLSTVAEAVRRSAANGLCDEVSLLDFNRHPKTGDAALHSALAREIGTGIRVRHVRYGDDPAALMRTIAGLRGILAMRLHAAVFGFCMGTPTLNFAYHEKCREWSGMVGAPPSLLLDALSPDADTLALGLERMLAGDTPAPSLTPDEAVERSARNWRWGKP